MRATIRNAKTRRGFTLLEIIIVAALISLFSGIATFGVQQMLANSKLKSVVGETRQLGQALLFAYQDVGLYPAIGYLNHNKDVINNRFGFDRVHTMGFVLSDSKLGNTYRHWGGAYFAASPTRNQLNYRFKQLVTMRLKPTTGGQYLDEMDWPADQWGNPYVLYLFRYNSTTDTWEFIRDIGQEPDFFGAVVSYGPDGVPGTPTAGETIETLRAYRLFEHPEFRVPIFDSLEPDFGPNGYSPAREAMYSRPAPRIGIVDPGSDDIIYNIN